MHSVFRYDRPIRAVWALRVNRPCGLMYRTIFLFRMHVKPELAYRLQTFKVHRNLTLLKTCPGDVNIVNVASLSGAVYHR